MTSRISIENMEFYAYHGCFKEEQVIGTRFLVNVSFTLDTAQAQQTDDLKHTVNYQEVYNCVKREMEIHSDLIEHAAGRILNAINITFPQVSHILVKVSKLNPPLGGKMEAVSIELAE